MKPWATWWWQLQGTLPAQPQQSVVDLDLFDTDESLIRSYLTQGKLVICYFSGGSYEAWRSDAQGIPLAARGLRMQGWDELWLDTRDPGVKAVMASRIELAKTKGCSGVEIDNVDGYGNTTGFPITQTDSAEFLNFLASEAHARGLIIGLKNSPDVVPRVHSNFDFAVVEQCAFYNECAMYQLFIDHDKAVFQAEYSTFRADWCTQAKARRFSLTFFTQGNLLNGQGAVFCE